MFATAMLNEQFPIFDLSWRLLAWEAFVSIAILGWGLAGMRAMGRPRPAIGIAMCTGIAVWLMVGGWLNLFQWAYRPVLWAGLSIGMGLFLWRCGRNEFWTGLRAECRSFVPVATGVRIAGGLIALYLGLCVVAHLGSFTWNRWDDVQGYMPFAEKASVMGGLQADPFSERRVATGVGGSIYLDATMLAGAGDIGIDYLEGDYGFVALLLCAGTMTRVFKLREWGVLVVFGAVGLFTMGRVNLTAVNLSAALFFSVLLTLLEDDGKGVGGLSSAVLTGLLVGAAGVLKSTNIPFCGLLLCLAAGWQGIRERSLRPLRRLCVMGLVVGVVFLPWAVKHQADEGTLLFPSLGRGFHVTAFGFPAIATLVPLKISLLASVTSFTLPAVACVLLLLLWRDDGGMKGPILCFLAAGAIAAPMFSVSIAAEGLERYLLPMENLCALLFLMSLLAMLQMRVRNRWMWAAGGWVLLWGTMFVRTAAAGYFYRDPGEIALLSGSADYIQPYEMVLRPPELLAWTERVRRAQASIPAGGVVLENIEAAYGLDWKRNDVLIADYPGMASLPPGMPLDSTPDALRRYLLSKGIHYVMLDRGIFFETNYMEFRGKPQIKVAWQEMLEIPRKQVQGYSRMEYFVSNHVRDLLGSLAATQPKLYDDGRLEVLCLDGSS